MPVQLLVSDSLWNEKDHCPSVSVYDDLTLWAHFDQPVSHELEYIENDITRFWVDLELNGEPAARLSANKILAELMDEAKTFKNGKFKFPILSMPNALSNSYHAAFALKLAGMPAGKYTVNARFYTDNPIQQDRVLAELNFELDLPEGAQGHLQQVAQANLEQRADREDDVQAKAEAFERIKQGGAKFDTVRLTLQNTTSAPQWLRVGTGEKIYVEAQSSVTVSAPAGDMVYQVKDEHMSRQLGTVSPRAEEQTIVVDY